MPQKNTDLGSANDTLLGFTLAGWIILCVRFVQGFIFWGGGSRRFIYAPQKLDPDAAQWMANKLQSAMPGALLGASEVISYLLQHFILLYVAIILFSLVELVSGMALMLGCFTRAAGLITAGISIVLMLIFGWQGSTCLDEWTMAISNLAMGFTLALSGSSIYSIDNWLLRTHPGLLKKRWFLYAASGPWPYERLKKIGIFFLSFTVVFTLATYDYYRGAIFSRYHMGPVSAVSHHISLSNGQLFPNGAIRFTAYVDAGEAATPSNIVRIELLTEKGADVETWESEQLSALPAKNIVNEYAYNRFTTGPYGMMAPVSAKATITLPPTHERLSLLSRTYQLRLYTVDGRRFNLNLHQGTPS